MSVSLSSTSASFSFLDRVLFLLGLPDLPDAFSVAEVGVGWLEPLSLSLLLANDVDTGVGAPGVDAVDAASMLSGWEKVDALVKFRDRHERRRDVREGRYARGTSATICSPLPSARPACAALPH